MKIFIISALIFLTSFNANALVLRETTRANADIIVWLTNSRGAANEIWYVKNCNLYPQYGVYFGTRSIAHIAVMLTNNRSIATREVCFR
tara:strand:+ start:3214 stop:3480 length:267 start_codon:yes stop_codon:yes gene_type:complete